jgi:hypothetical protein
MSAAPTLASELNVGFTLDTPAKPRRGCQLPLCIADAYAGRIAAAERLAALDGWRRDLRHRVHDAQRLEARRLDTARLTAQSTRRSRRTVASPPVGHIRRRRQPDPGATTPQRTRQPRFIELEITTSTILTFAPPGFGELPNGLRPRLAALRPQGPAVLRQQLRARRHWQRCPPRGPTSVAVRSVPTASRWPTRQDPCRSRSRHG